MFIYIYLQSQPLSLASCPPTPAPGKGPPSVSLLPGVPSASGISSPKGKVQPRAMGTATTAKLKKKKKQTPKCLNCYKLL